MIIFLVFLLSAYNNTDTLLRFVWIRKYDSHKRQCILHATIKQEFTRYLIERDYLLLVFKIAVNFRFVMEQNIMSLT